jgi:hypothetical protein
MFSAILLLFCFVFTANQIPTAPATGKVLYFQLPTLQIQLPAFSVSPASAAAERGNVFGPQSLCHPLVPDGFHEMRRGGAETSWPGKWGPS